MEEGHPGCPYSSTCDVSAVLKAVSSLLPSRLSRGPLQALLGLDEAVLFVTPEFDLGIAGLTALVVELHGRPIVVGATLRWTDGGIRRTHDTTVGLVLVKVKFTSV